MYLLSIIFRAAWSVTIGLPFFVLGLVIFLLLDILFPTSDKGYKVLNAMYKLGSLGAFKGVRLEKDDYVVVVEKKR